MSWLQGVTSDEDCESQSCQVQVPSAELSALLLMLLSSPCPAPTVPQMSSHHPHPPCLHRRPCLLTLMSDDGSTNAVLGPGNAPFFTSTINDPESGRLKKLVIYCGQEQLAVFTVSWNMCCWSCWLRSHVFTKFGRSLYQVRIRINVCQL